MITLNCYYLLSSFSIPSPLLGAFHLLALILPSLHLFVHEKTGVQRGAVTHIRSHCCYVDQKLNLGLSLSTTYGAGFLSQCNNIPQCQQLQTTHCGCSFHGLESWPVRAVSSAQSPQGLIRLLSHLEARLGKNLF